MGTSAETWTADSRKLPFSPVRGGQRMDFDFSRSHGIFPDGPAANRLAT
jgi:hypothetical protein